MAILKSKKAGHAAGIYADMTLDGPEIGTLVVIVDRAKNLPNRKTMGKQDPYCAMRLGKYARKTETDRRGGQTPKWDQELRFDVHESPDYYKLKCSIFNDDKKTDLIGESWIDLTDVIKPGGGQNDLWQQLNFKGKYAGDVRLELTYYDTREKKVEKKKERDPRLQSGPPPLNGSDLSMSDSRSLGPREIKRRPLPSDPATQSPAALSIQQMSIAPPPQDYYDQQPIVPQFQPQQSFDDDDVHAPVPLRPYNAYQQESNYDQYTEEPLQLEDEFQHDYPPQPPAQLRPRSSRQDQTWQQQPPQDMRSSYHSHAGYGTQDQYAHNLAQEIPTYPDEGELWLRQRPNPVHMQSEPLDPYHAVQLSRPIPPSNHSDSQLQRYSQHDGRVSSSPTKSLPYQDSPLRRSMNPQEFQDLQHLPQDVPPPLPPKHRETTPRRPRGEYPPNAFVPQPLRVTPKRSSISDRSPLQSIEDDYDAYKQDFPVQAARRVNTFDIYSSQQESPSQQVDSYNRRRSYVPENEFVPSPQLQRPQPGSRKTSYEIRHPSYGGNMVGEPQQMPSEQDFRSSQQGQYMPQPPASSPVPYRDQSPGPSPMGSNVIRKAVGDQPKRLSGMPFDPDSYDVLNPAGSPATNAGTVFETPEQAKESARFREVEKLRDIGPIIGNDGREIDPSDHLPSDTWAPEPERKVKKPEHVITIRSKNDRQGPAGARASPVVVRRNGRETTPQAQSPAAASSPVSGPGSYSNTPTGRNRLQKPAHARPLPNQPYPAAHPQPHVAGSMATASVSTPALVEPDSQRYAKHRTSFHAQPPPQPMQDNTRRNSGGIHRPALSEYQVPITQSRVGSAYSTNQYAPSSQYEPATKPPPQSYPTTFQPNTSYGSSSSVPPSQALVHSRRSSYNPPIHNDYNNDYSHDYENNTPQQPHPYERQHERGHSMGGSSPSPNMTMNTNAVYDDPLAAEMSMIDIGPSRGGRRTLARPTRGYGY